MNKIRSKVFKIIEESNNSFKGQPQQLTVEQNVLGNLQYLKPERIGHTESIFFFIF